MTQEVTVIQGIETRELFTASNLDYAIEKIEKDIKSIHTDPSTEKGRKDIISLSVKVRDSKTLVDKVRKKLGEDLRLELNTINEIGNKAVERLQKLQDETRLPVTEFENKEKERVAIHENSITLIGEWSNRIVTYNKDDLQQANDFVMHIKTVDFEEFKQRADIAIISLEKSIADRLVAIEKDAELARLQKAEQDRIQKEREQLIAKEAADRATKEAEERAAKEKADIERKIQAEREEAIRKQKEAEESLKRAEQEKIKAVEAERIKIEAEKQAEIAATAKREADIEHRKSINNSALSPILAIIHAVQADDLTAEEGAKELIKMIAKGEIPHVSIRY